jgi:hypothetical protein
MILQVTNRLCVRSAVDPLCAKHDNFGACFNSVTIDPSSINSGQKLGKFHTHHLHYQLHHSLAFFILLIFLLPGHQDQTPRLSIKFNITTWKMSPEKMRFDQQLLASLETAADHIWPHSSVSRTLCDEMQKNKMWSAKGQSCSQQRYLRMRLSKCLNFYVKDAYIATKTSNIMNTKRWQKRHAALPALATSNATMLTPLTSPCSKCKLRLGAIEASVYLDAGITRRMQPIFRQVTIAEHKSKKHDSGWLLLVLRTRGRQMQVPTKRSQRSGYRMNKNESSHSDFDALRKRDGNKRVVRGCHRKMPELRLFPSIQIDSMDLRWGRNHGETRLRRHDDQRTFTKISGSMVKPK